MRRQNFRVVYLLISIVSTLLYTTSTYANSKEACDALFLGMSNLENKDNCGFIGGGGIGYQTPFTNDNEVKALPLVTVVWEDFYIDGNEAGLLFWGDISLTEYYLVTTFLRLASDGYSVKGESQLTGLKDTDEAVEAGVRLSWGSKWGEVHFSVANDISSKHESFVADMGYAYGWKFDDMTIAANITASYQSSDTANYYYGVSANQVAANRPLYKLGSVVNLSVGYFVEKPLNEKWSLIHFAQLTQYPDDVKKSPLTVNDNGFAVGIGVTYSF